MTMATQCSTPIDPVSPDAPSDLSSTAQLIEFRARVVDLPNTGTVNSTLFIPKAGVQNVTLANLAVGNHDFVVDTNGDGFCDSINPLIVPVVTPNLPNEAAVLSLSPVTPSGAPVFSTSAVYGGTNAGCAAVTTPTTFTKVCNGEPFQSVIIKEPITNAAEVYGIPPIDALNCMGYAFDAAAANIADGWACVAVGVSDALNNHSVSAPMRICIDKAQTGLCASAGPPPNCTGTYDTATATVSNTACTFRPFLNSSGQQNPNAKQQSINRTHALDFERGKTKVTVEPNRCTLVKDGTARYLVSGFGNSWLGQRPPEGVDYQTFSMIPW